MSERTLQSTSPRGLDHTSLPMRLWHKAKKHGIWDPRDIDFSTDRAQWPALTDAERDVLLRLTALFQGGEESVTLDLLPLIGTVAAEGRLEEEMYLTSFLWEEAKHVEVFRRFLDEVAAERSDLARFHGPAYRAIFHAALPSALQALRTDASPRAQAVAAVTYNMIVEGVLAESGYHGYHAILERNDLMPGMRRAVALLKRDESRHIAYGVYLLSRLVAAHEAEVWPAIEEQMGALLLPALEVIQEVFAPYEVPPFGLRIEEFTEFAMQQFQFRLERLETARRLSVEDLHAMPEDEVA